jgi:prepilin-type N-terminal cleavage/methylation domain-containing protein
MAMQQREITKRRGGFTLVELLVVVLIICILATITLFALFNAGEAAKKGRTRSQIARIHDLLTPVWESYLTRRVPINITAGTNPSVAAQTRVDGIRELMRMELPDRKSDVVDNAVVISARPSLSQAYLRKAQAITGGVANWTTTHQGSECLYMILSRMQDGESNGLEHFHATEIGDTDNDGMLEVLDGWGKPIAFLRWAPGFTADVTGSALQKAPASAEPDPVDPTGVRGSPPNTYFLFPLVFSAGPDTAYDIAVDGSSALQYNGTTPKNDPFTTAGGQKMGAPITSTTGWQDNIHNHLIDISIK